jgi:CHAD domain-containing protein
LRAHATTPVLPALSRSVRRQTDAFARWLARARAGDEKGIHQTRVATRRLREALPLLVAAGAGGAGAVRRALRRLTRALGPVREIDVGRRVLQDLARRHRWPPTTAARVDAHFAALRTHRLEALLDEVDRLDGARLAERLDAVLAAVDADAPRAAALVFLVPRVRGRARALGQRIDAAGTLYSVQPLHDVRLAAKKLRYLLELAAAATGAAVAPEVRRLKRVQTVLGRLHDLHVVQHGLQEVAAGRADGLLARRLAQMDRDVEADCRELHARYLRAAPALAAQARQLAREGAALPASRRARMASMRLTPPRPARVRG